MIGSTKAFRNTKELPTLEVLRRQGIFLLFEMWSQICFPTASNAFICLKLDEVRNVISEFKSWFVSNYSKLQIRNGV